MTEREKTEKAIGAIWDDAPGEMPIDPNQLEVLAISNAQKLDAVVELTKYIPVVVRVSDGPNGVKKLSDAIQEILDAEHR